MKHSVSIILPFYNSEETLVETLQSVFEEIARSPQFVWELIALDDGSTDRSVEIVESWSEKIHINLQKLEHTGTPATARNRGIDLCESEFMFFLDADDILLSRGLSTAIQYAIDNESDVVLPRLQSLGGREVPRGMYKNSDPDVEFLKSRVYWAMNPMKVLRTEFVKKHGIRFDTTLRKDSDQPFSLRAYLAAEKISVLADPPVVGFRFTPSGSNLTLRPYLPSFCYDYLTVMMRIFDESGIDRNLVFPIIIRNWEIEIAREFIWKRLGKMPQTEWLPALEWLHQFSKERLIASMLPKTSIRWRGIVGMIGIANYDDLQRLLQGRQLVLDNSSRSKKLVGMVLSNWIRLKATLFLPKSL